MMSRRNSKDIKELPKLPTAHGRDRRLSVASTAGKGEWIGLE